MTLLVPRSRQTGSNGQHSLASVCPYVWGSSVHLHCQGKGSSGRVLATTNITTAAMRTYDSAVRCLHPNLRRGNKFCLAIHVGR